jgi:AraC-like DNA-binding protein
VDWVSLLIGIGAAHAIMLSVFAGVAAQRRSGHAWLATLFAILAITVTAILVTHRTEGFVESIAMLIEGVGAWAVGPVLYAFVRNAIDRPLAPRELTAHFSACAALVALYTLGVLLTPWPAVQWTAPAYELGYSLLSAVTFARGRRTADRSARGYWWPLAALALMFAVHAGQAMRLLAPELANDVVPLLGALGASLILLAMLVSQAQRLTGPRYARSALSRAELEGVYAALQRTLDGPPQLYLDLNLSLAQLSAAAGAQAHHASQALSEIGGVSFYELLTARRVADAQRRLLDPANSQVAVDVLGVESGFRSRSAFYSAFKAATGATPAEYRRTAGKIVSRTLGKDHEDDAARRSRA